MTTTISTNPHFATTGIEVTTDRGTTFHAVHLVADVAIAWDAPAEGTNCAVYSDRLAVFSYAELKITGRRVRQHTGGVWGTAARIRFTGEDDSGEWVECVVRAS